MAKEKQSLKQVFDSSTPKQKAIAVVFVLIVLFIIYQVWGLVKGSGSSAPSPVPVVNTMTNNAPTTPVTMQPGSASAPVAMNNLPTTAPSAAPKETLLLNPPKEAPEMIDIQQKEQLGYLQSLNTLQSLKVEKEIAETTQAIATAKLATNTANKKIDDLLKPPAPPVIPAGAYANALNGPGTSPIDSTAVAAGGTIPLPPGVTPPPSPPKEVIETPYVVISLSMEFNRWTAVLGLLGKLYSVNIGDTLVDGSIVASINRNGVALVKDGKRRRINLIPSI